MKFTSWGIVAQKRKKVYGLSQKSEVERLLTGASAMCYTEIRGE